jgi:hypothetical protein
MKCSALSCQPSGTYADQAALTRPADAVSWAGLLFFDVDLDGLLDLLVVNGHIDEGEPVPDVRYAQPPHLFLFAIPAVSSTCESCRRLAEAGAAPPSPTSTATAILTC